jgi:integrase
LSAHSKLPSYRLHRPSGQAVVTLPDGLGSRRDVYLGIHGTEESRSEYLRVVTEWQAGGQRQSGPSPDQGQTVNEVILAFWKHAEQHYRRPDGTPTSELSEYRRTFKVLKALYGHTAAADLGPLALKAVRQRMVEAGCCRGVVNQRIGRVKRMVKWAVENELVPPSVLHGLQAVRGLQRGRSEARETERVKPAPLAFVEAALPHLPRQVEALVQLLRQSGMRPGEACIMRGIDLDTSGAVWFYRPAQHKTAWHGLDRLIALGAKAQAILRPWLRLNVEEFLFQPREARNEFDANRRRWRKTPLTPSQRARGRKARPKRRPGDRYTPGSLSQAVARACLQAHAPTCDRCKQGKKEKSYSWHRRCRSCPGLQAVLWSPGQLRHTFATDVRRRFGIEAAQVLLGHQRADVTQVYAERNLGLAERVVAEIG